jgi:uncharacterized protein YjbJ (UPF0337 family)
MSNQSARSEGVAQKIGGKIKKGIGRVLGNERMTAEGRATELKGKTKEEGAKASEWSKGKIEEVAGAVKSRVGHLIGNEQMAAEGKAKEVKGQARQKANK